MSLANQSEDFTRRHYKRTVYADTLCKEIRDTSLKNLELSLRILRRVVSLTSTNGSAVGDDRRDLTALLDDETFKSRYLRRELDNMDYFVQLMKTVGIPDQSLRVATGEIPGLCMDFIDATKKRKAMEEIVRRTTAYKSRYYRSIQ